MLIEVSDKRGKYATKSYEVAADSEILAAGDAIKLFIKDSGHPPYQVGQSFSRYFSRFQTRRIGK